MGTIAPAVLSDLKQLCHDSHWRAASRFITSGIADLDQTLGGGLAYGALHEVFSAEQADAAAATAFILGFVRRADTQSRIFWARHERADAESGELYALGLSQMGLDPSRFVLVVSHDPRNILRAGAEALRSAAFDVVLVEIWTMPKILDLTATRRFAMASAKAGSIVFLLRAAARPMPSAAMTRWSVKAFPSQPLEANAPGYPACTAKLIRHRGGLPEQSWNMEWDHDKYHFRTPLSGSVAAHAPDRSYRSQGISDVRRAG